MRDDYSKKQLSAIGTVFLIFPHNIYVRVLLFSCPCVRRDLIAGNGVSRPTRGTRLPLLLSLCYTNGRTGQTDDGRTTDDDDGGRTTDDDVDGRDRHDGRRRRPTDYGRRRGRTDKPYFGSCFDIICIMFL